MQISRNKVGMTKLHYALLRTSGILSFLWAHPYHFSYTLRTLFGHSSDHFSYILRTLFGHSLDHLDYSDGHFFCPMVSLQYDTAKRLYSTKTKHNILRPHKMVLSHLRTLTAIHIHTKNLTILHRFKHQIIDGYGWVANVCQDNIVREAMANIASHFIDRFRKLVDRRAST